MKRGPIDYNMLKTFVRILLPDMPLVVTSKTGVAGKSMDFYLKFSFKMYKLFLKLHFCNHNSLGILYKRI